MKPTGKRNLQISGAMNRKMASRRQARIDDYTRMVSRPDFKSHMAYRRPGSNKK